MDEEREQLRKYLLGTLGEEQAALIDAQLFSGDAMLRRLQEERELLVEDYVGGRLRAEENRLFREQCARSPELRREVSQMQTLLRGLQHRAISASSAASRFRQRFFLILSPALAAALCIAGFLYVHERRAVRQLQTAQNAAALLPARTPAGTAGEPFTAFLAATVTRGAGSMPQIVIPGAASSVDLQVEVRDAQASDRQWNVTLAQQGEPVWKSARVDLHVLGPEAYLDLHLDASLLRPGAYTLMFVPSTRPTGEETRQFVVTQGS